MAKTVLQKNYLITKHNSLNEMRYSNMTLQELRFFTIYLSKINPKDESTRIVRFSLIDFQAIMELGRIDIKKLKNVVDGLLFKTTGIDLPSGGFERFQIFQRCRVEKDVDGEWYIEIEAHNMALPLMFNLKGRYFKYELWNALQLKSKNQLRMYEILKQYENVGYRVLTIEKLKEQLGIDKNEYSRYDNLKKWVLNSCQQALAKYTDISFTYEPHGKKGKGGKIIELKFTITKNKDFVDPLSLAKFIKLNNEHIIDGDDEPAEVNDYIAPQYKERIEFFIDACNDTFSWDEMVVINNILNDKMRHISSDELECYNFLLLKYNEMQIYDKRDSGIKNKFKYFCKMIGG